MYVGVTAKCFEYVGVIAKCFKYVGIRNISGHSRGRRSIFTLKIVWGVLMSYLGISEEHFWLAGRMVLSV